MRILLRQKNNHAAQMLCIVLCAVLALSVIAYSWALLLEAGLLLWYGILFLPLVVKDRSIRMDFSLFCFLYSAYLLLFRFDAQYKGVSLGIIAPWCFLPLAKRLCRNAKSLLYLVFGVGIIGCVLSAIVLLRHDYADKMWIGIVGNIAVNSNQISYIFGLGSISFLYLSIFRASKYNWLYRIFGGIAFIAVLLCQSRGALVATSVGLGILLYFAKGKRVKHNCQYAFLFYFYILLGVVFVSYYSLSHEMSFFNSNGRIGLWKEALQIWRRNPLFGCGVYQVFGEHPSSHNLIFDVLAQSGIVGLILMFGIWGTVLKATRREGLAFYAFAFMEAMLDTRQYYIIAIALILGYLVAKSKKGGKHDSESNSLLLVRQCKENKVCKKVY